MQAFTIIMLLVFCSISGAKDFGGWWVKEPNTPSYNYEDGKPDSSVWDGDYITASGQDSARVFFWQQGKQFFMKKDLVRDPRLTTWWRSSMEDDYQSLWNAVHQCSAMPFSEDAAYEVRFSQDAVIMDIILDLMAVVPVELFQGRGEEDETSKWVLAESLMPEQISKIMVYYTMFVQTDMVSYQRDDEIVFINLFFDAAKKMSNRETTVAIADTEYQVSVSDRANTNAGFETYTINIGEGGRASVVEVWKYGCIMKMGHERRAEIPLPDVLQVMTAWVQATR